MKVRILTAIGMAVVGIPILIFSDTIAFPIALAILSLFAVYEMLRVIGFDKKYFVSIPAYLMALGFPFGAYFVGEWRINYILILAAALFAYLFYLFYVAVFMRGKLKFSEVGEAFAAVAYVVASFTSMAVLRYMQAGIWLFVMLLVCAWGSDVFAYFTGVLFGKHKLIPEISPKKTVEGSIGGIVCASLLLVLFGFIVSKVSDYTPNYIVLAVAGVVLSASSQIGDLIASLIKREHDVKDYGKIFPGHGGVMDRFDSVMSIATILMIIANIIAPFA